jgi:hypothetical protein
LDGIESLSYFILFMLDAGITAIEFITVAIMIRLFETRACLINAIATK